MSVNKGSFTTVTQYHFIEPFSEDNITNISQITKIYNFFVKKGEASYGTVTRRHVGNHIGNSIPTASGRVFDHLGQDFSGTWGGGLTVSFTGGTAIVNGIFIEVEGFTIDVFASENHWRNQSGTWGYNASNTWGFPSDGTGYGTICLYFKPYSSGTTPSLNEAEIMMAEPSAVDFTYMAPIVHVQAIRTGGTINQVNLLLEHSSISSYPIEQLGYWRDFIIDGGNLG